MLAAALGTWAMAFTGLFILVAATMALALFGKPRPALALFLVTLILVCLSLWHHATDTLAISL
jgi:hypothetical protein